MLSFVVAAVVLVSGVESWGVLVNRAVSSVKFEITVVGTATSSTEELDGASTVVVCVRFNPGIVIVGLLVKLATELKFPICVGVIVAREKARRQQARHTKTVSMAIKLCN